MNTKGAAKMTITREMRIPIQAASRVAVKCENCKGEVVIDLTVSGHVEWATRKNQASGASCPFCNTAFGQGLHGISNLQQAVTALQALEVSFCIEEATISKR
jgi:hypothetical protein